MQGWSWISTKATTWLLSAKCNQLLIWKRFHNVLSYESPLFCTIHWNWMNNWSCTSTFLLEKKSRLVLSIRMIFDVLHDYNQLLLFLMLEKWLIVYRSIWFQRSKYHVFPIYSGKYIAWIFTQLMGKIQWEEFLLYFRFISHIKMSSKWSRDQWDVLSLNDPHWNGCPASVEIHIFEGWCNFPSST